DGARIEQLPGMPGRGEGAFSGQAATQRSRQLVRATQRGGDIGASARQHATSLSVPVGTPIDGGEALSLATAGAVWPGTPPFLLSRRAARPTPPSRARPARRPRPPAGRA